MAGSVNCTKEENVRPETPIGERIVDAGEPTPERVVEDNIPEDSCQKQTASGIPEAGSCHSLTVVVPNKTTVVMGLRWIPRGTFTMGSPETETPHLRGSGEVQHKVELSQGYWMMETEVTQELYKLVTDKDSREFTKCGPKCPIVAVSWYEAAFFANLLSTLKGLETCYTCSNQDGELLCTATKPKEYTKCRGWRLPTEAEWEYAYRARTTTALYNGEWSVSNSIKIGWGRENQKPSLLQKVGLKAPNAWGLYDMAGNVWEWTYNWHGPYDTSQVPSLDPSEPRERRKDPTRTTGELYNKVIRGGSWFAPVSQFRAANRYPSDPRVKTGGTTGFRLVRIR